jgi:tryptophanyl-tRNA synthetase
MRRAYAEGIAWGEAKQQTFELINTELLPGRERYEALMAEPRRIEEALVDGAARARAWATPFLGRIREAVGIRKL